MKQTGKLLREIVIPEYITKVKMSDAQRAKYHNKYDKKGVSRNYKDDDGNEIPVPKTYLAKVENGDWRFGPSGYLRNGDDERVVANPGSAGKPNYETLSGNRFMSGYGHFAIRAKLIKNMKLSFLPHVQKVIEEEGAIPNNQFPIQLTWDLYTTIDKSEFDLSNFFFYYKYFEDTLHMTEHPETEEELTPMIPDDSIKYVTQPGGAPRLFPIDNWENRKFVFRIWQEQRKSVTNHEYWNGFTN